MARAAGAAATRVVVAEDHQHAVTDSIGMKSIYGAAQSWDSGAGAHADLAFADHEVEAAL